MDPGENGAASISSRAELQRVLTELALRVDTPETELAAERARRGELEGVVQTHLDR